MCSYYLFTLEGFFTLLLIFLLMFGALLGGVVSAGLGALNKWVSNKIDSSSQVRTYKRKAAIDYEYAQKMAADNDAYQRNLIVDRAGMEKAGMQNAGLSVASLNGGSFQNVSSNAAQQHVPGALPPQSSPDVMSGALQALNGVVLNKTLDKLDKEIENVDEDTRLKGVEAHEKELVNIRAERSLEDEQALSNLRNEFVYYVTSQKLGSENADISAPRSFKYMSEERMLAILGGNQTKVQQQDTANAQAMAENQKYVYDFNVYRLFNDNPESAKAVVDVTFAERDKIQEEVRKLRNDNELFEACQEFYKLAVQLDLVKTKSEISKNYAEANQLNALAENYSNQMQAIFGRLQMDGQLAKLDGLLKIIELNGKGADLQFNFNKIMSDWMNKGQLDAKALGVCLLGGSAELLNSVGKGVGAGLGFKGAAKSGGKAKSVSGFGTSKVKGKNGKTIIYGNPPGTTMW